MRVFVDTNIVLDCMADRQPFAADARKLLILGAINEVELWLCPTQLTDLFYLLTDGGKSRMAAEAKSRLATVRKFVHVGLMGEDVIDAALRSSWDDFEDACLYQCALQVKPDVIITRNGKDFERSRIPVLTCAEFFDYLEQEKGLVYEEMLL